MSEWKRIDQLLAHLKRRQTLGGMTYQAAVDSELLIYAFEHIRATMIADSFKVEYHDLPALSETALDKMLKGLTS